MAKDKKVISLKNVPSKPPIWQTVTAFLLLDRLNSPEWVWGAVGVFFLLIWGASIYGMVTQKHVDIFEDR